MKNNIQEFYSNLSVLYLKLFQYEKHLGQEFIHPIEEHINKELKFLINEYDSKEALTNFTLQKIFQSASIDTNFNHRLEIPKIKKQLIEDLKKLYNVSDQMIQYDQLYSFLFHKVS